MWCSFSHCICVDCGHFYCSFDSNFCLDCIRKTMSLNCFAHRMFIRYFGLVVKCAWCLHINWYASVHAVKKVHMKRNRALLYGVAVGMCVCLPMCNNVLKTEYTNWLSIKYSLTVTQSAQIKWNWLIQEVRSLCEYGMFLVLKWRQQLPNECTIHLHNL